MNLNITAVFHEAHPLFVYSSTVSYFFWLKNLPFVFLILFFSGFLLKLFFWTNISHYNSSCIEPRNKKKVVSSASWLFVFLSAVQFICQYHVVFPPTLNMSHFPFCSFFFWSYTLQSVAVLCKLFLDSGFSVVTMVTSRILRKILTGLLCSPLSGITTHLSIQYIQMQLVVKMNFQLKWTIHQPDIN